MRKQGGFLAKHGLSLHLAPFAIVVLFCIHTGPCRIPSPEGQVKIKRRPVKPGVRKLEKVPVCRAGSCESSSKKKLKSKAKELQCGPGTSATSEGLFSGSQARSFTTRDDAGKLSSERLKKATRKSKVLQSALRVSRAGRDRARDGPQQSGKQVCSFWTYTIRAAATAHLAARPLWVLGIGMGGSFSQSSRADLLSFVQGEWYQWPFPFFYLALSWQRKNGALALSPRNAKAILSKGKKLAKVKNKVVNKQVGN